jgi:pyrimidine operon attenuation protein / uracil phosphoribosyltransferase
MITMITMIEFDSLYNNLKNKLSAVDRESTLVVGIHTGGYWLAERLHRELGFKLPLAALSTTLQRDDFATAGLHKQKLPTHLPLSLQGAHVLLVDDVLHTGRSVRAALNELFEYGRPASVKLAVLADRGGRQLPFAADYCGGIVSVPDGQALVLLQTDIGDIGLSLNLEVRP